MSTFQTKSLTRVYCSILLHYEGWVVVKFHEKSDVALE